MGKQAYRVEYSRALTAAAVMLAACDARVQLVEPRASAAPPAVLTLAAGDPALAQRAGWSSGVPGTTVFIRLNEDPTVLSYSADEHGVLSVPDLPAADYWVWAEKRPAGAALEAPLSAPPALGAGRRLSLQPGSQDTLRLRGQENGSLVLSEFYYHHPPVSVYGQGNSYEFHWYLEIHNNSDSTIYLDGKIIGAGFDYDIDAPLWPCAETDEFRNDPRGIWSQRFQAFPGSGHEHPLAPGGTVVIAEQAIDHSTLYPDLPDLSHADFQFYWGSRALNPAVPTMLPIQLSSGIMETMWLTSGVVFIAEETDIAALERHSGRYQGEFALFPRSAILDLAVLYSEFELVRYLVPLCRTGVDPSLDGLGAFARPYEAYRGDRTHLLSGHRKGLPNGRLQRTGTSAVDWEIRARSPGKVP